MYFLVDKMTSIQPNIRFFNTLTRKKELFKPLEPGKAKIYTCGPTVYDYAHMGILGLFCLRICSNAGLFLAGFKVTHVMNLTDIDDKTIKGSQNRACLLDNSPIST